MLHFVEVQFREVVDLGRVAERGAECDSLWDNPWEMIVNALIWMMSSQFKHNFFFLIFYFCTWTPLLICADGCNISQVHLELCAFATMSRLPQQGSSELGPQELKRAKKSINMFIFITRTRKWYWKLENRAVRGDDLGHRRWPCDDIFAAVSTSINCLAEATLPDRLWGLKSRKRCRENLHNYPRVVCSTWWGVLEKQVLVREIRRKWRQRRSVIGEFGKKAPHWRYTFLFFLFSSFWSGAFYWSKVAFLPPGKFHGISWVGRQWLCWRPWGNSFPVSAASSSR